VLERALEEASIDRDTIYLTNVVKHFKWEPRGKRRIHKKPSAREIAACRPWLDTEIALVKPRAIVCLGATAAQDLFGPKFRITRERGKIMEDTGIAPMVMATVHPSSILRAPDHDAREKARREFMDDLAKAAKHLKSHH